MRVKNLGKTFNVLGSVDESIFADCTREIFAWALVSCQHKIYLGFLGK